MPSNAPDTIGEPIKDPHRHDVLSGRGNYVNNHPGNEHFRSLVRMHKLAYVATPKTQKPKFSRLIYDAIKNLDPPGRFLKQDDKTKLWLEIVEKKALDKTRQALREGAPEIRNILEDGAEAPGAVPPILPPNQRQQEADKMAVQMEQQIQAQLMQLQQIHHTQHQLQQIRTHGPEPPTSRSPQQLPGYGDPTRSHGLQSFGGPQQHMEQVSPRWDAGGSNYSGGGGPKKEYEDFSSDARYGGNDTPKMDMPPPENCSRYPTTESYPLPQAYNDTTLPLSGGRGGERNGDHGMTLPQDSQLNKYDVVVMERLNFGPGGAAPEGGEGASGSRLPKRGLAREDSVQLGEILTNGKEDDQDAPESPRQEVRRNSAVQMSMGMSFSLGDIDSGLSKMMEDSLDLDGHGGAGGYFTQSRHHNFAAAAANNGPNPYSAANGTAVGNLSNSNFSTAYSSLSSSGGTASAFASKPTGMHGRQVSDATITASGNAARQNSNSNMSFSQLIDFGDSYNASFKQD